MTQYPLHTAAARLLFLALALPAAVSAQAPALAPAPVAACQVPTSGTLYRIKADSAPPACLTGHVELSLLPSRGAGATDYALLRLENNGLGATASFAQTNAAAGAPALAATSLADGATAWFVQNNPNTERSALYVEAYGRGAAAQFDQKATTTTWPALATQSWGTTAALYAGARGTGIGVLAVTENAANGAPTLLAQTKGKGYAVQAVTADPTTTAPTIKVENFGDGTGLYLHQLNGSTAAPAVQVTNAGSGPALSVVNTESSNSQPGAVVVTHGLGMALYVDQANAAAQAPALVVRSSSTNTNALEVVGNGLLKGDLLVTGNQVVQGAKNAVVPTRSGMRLVYSEESSEVWFSDYGTARLTGDELFIPVDSVFAQTVSLKRGYHVFVEAYGPADLYVSERGARGFRVKARRAGAAGTEFSYRLVARRAGFEDRRLARVPALDSLAGARH